MVALKIANFQGKTYPIKRGGKLFKKSTKKNEQSNGRIDCSTKIFRINDNLRRLRMCYRIKEFDFPIAEQGEKHIFYFDNTFQGTLR